nr:permease prefix domain 1-containing protein [Enterococcus lactis]
MDTIRNYLESLFIGVPRSAEIEKLKADLLANMEDHYHELMGEGKNEQEAIGTVISTFGSIDELLEELDVKKENPSPETESNPASIYLSEAENYWKEYRAASLQVASGVLFTCLSFAGFLFFCSTGYAFMGVSCLIFGIALAVGFFIVSGMKITRLNHFLYNRKIPEKVLAEAKEKEEAYQRSFGFSLIAGIGLCIFSLFPLFASILWYMDGSIGASGFFVTVGTGVFLIIYGSLVRHSYRQFTQSTYSW